VYVTVALPLLHLSFILKQHPFFILMSFFFGLFHSQREFWRVPHSSMDSVKNSALPAKPCTYLTFLPTLQVITNDEIFTELVLCACACLPTELITLIFTKMIRRNIGKTEYQKEWVLEERIDVGSFCGAVGCDAEGNIFVSGTGGTIFRISSDRSKVETIFENPKIDLEFMTVSDDGSIFASCGANVMQISKNGEILCKLPQISNGVFLGKNGNFYSCYKTLGIQEFSSDGVLVRQISVPEIQPYHSFLEWNSGNFAVIHYHNSDIAIMSQDGSVISQFGGILQRPTCLIIDGNGILIVSDVNKVKFIDPKNGKILNVIEMKNFIYAISVNSDGNLIVTLFRDRSVYIYTTKKDYRKTKQNKFLKFSIEVVSLLSSLAKKNKF
jgi:hypothetical protein